MNINIPFLTLKDSSNIVTDDMELASAFLYFGVNRSESIKSLFSKQSKESISWISRGLYPLNAKLFSAEDKLYCVYDNVGSIRSSLQLKCNPEMNIHMDNDKMSTMDIRKKIETLKNLSFDMKKKQNVSLESNFLLSGYNNFSVILRGNDYDMLDEYSVNLSDNTSLKENNISFIRDIISRIEQSIENEIQELKNLGTLDDDSFKNSIEEKNRVYDEFKDKIYQTDKEVSSNIAKLIMERENKIRDIDKIYDDKTVFLTKDYIFNKSKYDIAEVYGNEIEMDIYKRSMSDANNKIEQFKKEANEEIKKVEKHYDDLIEEDKNKIKQAVDDRSKKIKECESLYTELHSTIDSLKKTISEDIFSRRNELDGIKGWFLKIDCIGDCETIDICIPFYIAEYEGSDFRYKLFIPQMLEEKGQFKTLISGISGKIPLPFEERDKFFDDLFKGFREILKTDESINIINSFSKNNLKKREGIKEKAEAGLKSILNYGYLNDKNYEKSISTIRDIFI